MYQSNDSGIFWFVISIAVVGLFIFIYVNVALPLRRKQKIQGIESGEKTPILERVRVGKYLGGLPDCTSTEPMVDCVITNSDFVFLSMGGGEIGRIPRNSVNDIIVEDKVAVTQRLTVTRMLALGLFSLAAPKKVKHKEMCLVIDWNDRNGMRWNTVFEISKADGFDVNSITNRALIGLKKHQLQKIQIIREDEKKCPYCAEIIRKDAIVCKYCNREIART